MSQEKELEIQLSILVQCVADLADRVSALEQALEEKLEPNVTRPESMEAVLAHAAIIGCPEPEARAFWDYFEASGWYDKNGNPVVNWKAKLSHWATRARARGPEAAHHGGAGKIVSDQINLRREHEEVCKQMASISGSYADHQAWSYPDLDRFRALKTRRAELRQLMGWKNP